MITHHLVRVGEQWQKSNVTATGPVFLHADEGHLQRKCLSIGFPLVFQDDLYRPICAEFPANPGIDMIYVSDSGRMILAEFKGTKYSAQKLLNEIPGKYYESRRKSMTDLLHYIQTKPLDHDVSRGAEQTIIEWLNCARTAPQTTLEELFITGHIVLAGVVPDSLPATLIERTNVPIVLFSVSLASSLAAGTIQVFDRVYRPGSDSVAQRNVILAAEEHLGSTQAATVARQRQRYTSADLDKFFTGSKCPPAIDYLYRKFTLNNKYQIKSGSGTKPSAMVQVRNRNGELMTILRFMPDYSVEVPGNIFQQQAAWGVSDTQLRQMLKTIENIFPNGILRMQPGQNLIIALDQKPALATKAQLDQLVEQLGILTGGSSHSIRR